MRLSWLVVGLLLLVVLEEAFARKHLTKDALREKKHAVHRRAATHSALNQMLRTVRKDHCGTTHRMSTRATKCGWDVSECDDPAVRDQYLNAPTASFRIMYNVLRDDNGQDPLPSNQLLGEEVAKLKSQLMQWFGLEADFKVRYVDNNALRYSYTHTTCTFSTVGDGKCAKECNLKQFGYDGGDCATPANEKNGCDQSLVGNGKCDEACNYKDFNWDGGECCSDAKVLPFCKEPGKKNVYDPKYNEPGNFRKAVFEATAQSVPSRPDVALSLYPNVFMHELLGVATFPNEQVALRPEGGYLSITKTLGNQEKETSIHELGHCIGLLHTFAGTTEQVNEENTYCSIDASCIENVNGANRDNVGDFCSDTAAEPKSFGCTAFDSISQDCTGTAFPLGNTHNYMSYQSDCGSETYFFSAQQKARARCYLDKSQIKAWLGTWKDIDITTPSSFGPPPPPTPSPSPTPTPSPTPAPSGWTCDPAFYGAKDGCDCECGVYDPDCDLITQDRIPEVFNCDSGVEPKCDKTTAKCVYRKAVPDAWQCDPMGYDSLDGCDCDCGAFDPDCNVNKTAAELFNCNPGGVCSASGVCTYPVPATWTCNPLQYNDGVTCNCNCGALDLDCDYSEATPPTVGCIGNEVCHLNDGTCVAAQQRFEFGEGVIQTAVPKVSTYSFVADDSVCESFVCDLEPSKASKTTVALLSTRPGCPGTLVDVFSLDIVDYEMGLQRGPSMGTIVTTNCDPTLLGNEMVCGLNDVTGLWTPVNTATCTPEAATVSRAAPLKTGTCVQYKICQPFKYYGIFRSVGFSIPKLFRARR